MVYVQACRPHMRCPRLLREFAKYDSLRCASVGTLDLGSVGSHKFSLLKAPLIPPVSTWRDVSLCGGAVEVPKLLKSDMDVLLAVLSVRVHPQAQGLHSESRYRRHRALAQADRMDRTAVVCVSAVSDAGMQGIVHALTGKPSMDTHPASAGDTTVAASAGSAARQAGPSSGAGTAGTPTGALEVRSPLAAAKPRLGS